MTVNIVFDQRVICMRGVRKYVDKFKRIKYTKRMKFCKN